MCVVCPSARTLDNLDACMVLRSPDLLTAAALMEVLTEHLGSLLTFSPVPDQQDGSRFCLSKPL